MVGLLAGLILQLSPASTASPEVLLTRLFASDAEATNFSAHMAWGGGIPAVCYAFSHDGVRKRNAAICGGAWAAYSLVNEFALHQPEGGRERALNLSSRLGSAALVTGVLLLFGKD
jgi:hypothetical protein